MKKIGLFLLLLSLSGGAWAQRYTVSGYIRDAATGEALIGASLYFPRLKTGTTANAHKSGDVGFIRLQTLDPASARFFD